MKVFLKWPFQVFVFFLLSVCFLAELALSADPPSLSAHRESLSRNFSSLWKTSLNFSHTPYSDLINVDDWHRAKGRIIPTIQHSLASVSGHSSVNVAVAGLQCVYHEADGDGFGVTAIVDLPKIFMSGYKSSHCRISNFGDFIDKTCASLPATAADIVQNLQAVKPIYNGLYGVGDGYAYSAFDDGYRHFRAFLEQNFSLRFGESSSLSSASLQRKLRLIKEGHSDIDRFSANFFHSEQAILTYLESEEGIDFLLYYLFDRLPHSGGKSQIIQLVLHISSFYDVCENYSATLFREAEVGRLFLRKLEERLKNHRYLYADNRILLLVETSGSRGYRDQDGALTRPQRFKEGVFFNVPLIAMQASPYVMRMQVGE